MIFHKRFLAIALLMGVANFQLSTFNFQLSTASAQAMSDIRESVAAYFANYNNEAYTSNDPIRLTDVEVDSENRALRLYANAGFASQPFTRATVAQIHRDVERLLPPPYNAYRITILANGTPIEELVPLAWDDTTASQRRWGNIDYRGNPWVTPLSLPYSVTRGLQGRHLSLWASHGRYYDQTKTCWQWQRPRLYCTTEDLFTQSIVVPFLIPMLENAGAIVFTPRERDWQRNEVIVDNDLGAAEGTYTESNGTYEWESAGTGFSRRQDVYFDGENPFLSGTSRKAEAQPRKRQASRVVWQPTLPTDGPYAVYVSYPTLPTSVSDAEYTVYHRGVATKFRVNQQMGGGTWVYLGTFDFAAGNSAANCVALTNQSNYRGVVSADAVRFGGGMGNIARGDSLHSFVRSGLPRFLEGSRYTAQWSGMPFAVYGTKDGTNDYAEDINARSLMTNRLARGSVYLPGDSGLCVPIELSLAVHSDAGFRSDLSHIGTLGIYTTGLNTPGDYEGLLAEGMLPSRRSRLMARDLGDIVMTQVDQDIRAQWGTWNRRQLYDRNYSESRVPEVPGIILETLSHQNYADLLLGHDPTFKLFLARAIYKGILRYTAAVHAWQDVVVQPLPVHDFAAELDERGDSVLLSWYPTADPVETQAVPTGYVVYTSEGSNGYDNGHIVYRNEAKLPVRRGVLTRYRVRAVNGGGASLPSEELCVYAAPQETHRLLIVNGFDRLAGPQPVDNDSLRGFDMNADPGVVYQRSPSYCGQQTNLRKGRGEDFGQSGSELEGVIVAGNTFDFPTLHAADFLAAHTGLSLSSCSHTALEQGNIRGAYHAIDLILGAQRADGYSTSARPSLPLALCQALARFASGGGALLVSGAYLSEEADADFARSVFHLVPDGCYALADSTNRFQGLNTQFTVYDHPNEERYSLRRLSQLAPAEGAFATVVSTDGGACLGVAYQSDAQRTLVYGMPLECIADAATRRAIMQASVQFLLPPPVQPQGYYQPNQ